MHQNVRQFIQEVKAIYPKYFNDLKVLDCGSLDINGNNRSFFSNCDYTGIDIVKGKNVDVVVKVHNFLIDVHSIYDTVISTEMLEHDVDYAKSLNTMFKLTKSNGLLLITAAGIGRKPHGTFASSPKDSPLTNDYYKNVTVEMLQHGFSFSDFSWFILYQKLGDIQFAGIKK